MFCNSKNDITFVQHKSKALMPTIVSFSHTHRKYWFSDYDEARKFYYLFDGEFAYAIGGYTVTI